MSTPTWSFGVPSGADAEQVTQPVIPAQGGPDPVEALREEIQGSWLGTGVDLLPEHYRVERRVAAAQRGVAAGLLAVGLLLGGAAWQAHTATSGAESELAEVEARQAALTSQAAQMAEVPRVLGELSAVQTARSTAFATDVRWYSYLDSLRSSVPTGVWLTSVSWGTATAGATGVTTGNPAGTTTAPAAAGSTAAVGSTGALVVTGRTQDPALVAAWLDSASGTEGFSSPAYSSLQRADVDGTPVYDFTATVDVTDEALSHRFDLPAASGASQAGTTTSTPSTPATGAGS